MKLFVDYTNWKGVRAWREIEPIDWGKGIEYGSYELEQEKPNIVTWVMHVCMTDRDGARRTLRLDHIHGFKCEE